MIFVTAMKVIFGYFKMLIQSIGQTGVTSWKSLGISTFEGNLSK
jgi:hypothetical protein